MSSTCGLEQSDAAASSRASLPDHQPCDPDIPCLAPARRQWIRGLDASLACVICETSVAQKEHEDQDTVTAHGRSFSKYLLGYHRKCPASSVPETRNSASSSAINAKLCPIRNSRQPHHPHVRARWRSIHLLSLISFSRLTTNPLLLRVSCARWRSIHLLGLISLRSLSCGVDLGRRCCLFLRGLVGTVLLGLVIIA